MNKMAQKLKTFSITALLICFTGISQTAYTDIGLPDIPLSVGNSVQPNIFLGLDDSGSMNSGFLIDHARYNPRSTTKTYRLDLPRRRGGSRANLYEQGTVYHISLQTVRTRISAPSEEFLNTVMNHPTGGLYTVDRKNLAKEHLKYLWRARTYEYNQMYYNPEVTYAPWFGVDRMGNAYANADPTAAPTNPYDVRDTRRRGSTLDPSIPPRGTQPVNLLNDLTTDFPPYTTIWDDVFWKTANDPAHARVSINGPPVDGFYPAHYYAWNDTNTANTSNAKNGLVDIDDIHTKIEIKATTLTYSTDGGMTNRNGRGDCAAVSVCTYAEEMQNFANWFTYNRNRLFVLKRAASELIDGSSARMGMAFMINSERSRPLSTPVADMTDTSASPTNKETMMKNLFRAGGGGGTPLRNFLKRIGRYFDQTRAEPHNLGFADDNPMLSLAEGGECQQNFAVIMTDGAWNSQLDVNTDGLSTNNPDGDSNSDFDGGPHADQTPRTLADQAMHYYERDLSSTLPNKVRESEYTDPASGITYTDNNPRQHMVTYAASLGLTGNDLITPPDHESGTPAPPWTAATKRSKENVKLDDLQHAAFNGRGLFLNSNSPEELIRNLNQALADIDVRTSVSGSSIGINSSTLRTTSRIFQASFNGKNWTGRLSASSLNNDGTINAEVWNAEDNLPTVTDPDDRNIFTRVSTGGIRFDDNPANAKLNAAIGSLVVGSTNYTAEYIIRYISGDRTDEGTGINNLRVRGGLLGDITNSNPISVGAQDLGYAVLPGFNGVEGTSYRAFLGTKATTIFADGVNPQTAVYVGANDGMLHAFHDSQSASKNGKELFAYIPSSLQGKLKELANPAYAHKFFVNGNHSVGDACIDNGTTCTWKSILVGTLGEGGRTVFALDVTDPFNFDASHVLWEYNFDDTRNGTTKSGEMGFIKSAPQVVRLNNGKWGVVFGNGYNSSSHTSRVYILDAKDGTEIAVMDTGVGNANNENGMASPLSVDEDGDRIVDTIFAGDLAGKLYKFDVSDVSANDWELVETVYEAKSANNVQQTITTRPGIIVNPEGGFNIIFGTGKYLETSDTVALNPYQVETMYSIWDSTSPVNGRSDLQQQSITEEIDVLVGNVTTRTRLVTENTIDYGVSNPKKGWYMDALAPSLTAASADGERIISDPLVRFDRAIFTTLIPPKNPCEVGGRSVVMEIDALSGARLENSVYDINGDGIIDDGDFVADASGAMTPVSGIYIPGTLAPPAVISIGSSLEVKQSSGIDSEVTVILESAGAASDGRQSWHQIH